MTALSGHCPFCGLAVFLRSTLFLNWGLVTLVDDRANGVLFGFVLVMALAKRPLLGNDLSTILKGQRNEDSRDVYVWRCLIYNCVPVWLYAVWTMG